MPEDCKWLRAVPTPLQRRGDPVANMKIKSALEILNTLADRAQKDSGGGYQIGGIRYGDLAAASIGLREVLCDASDCQHKVDHKLADILKLEAGSLDRIRKMLGNWLKRMEDTNWEVTGSGGPDGLTLSDLRIAAENLRKVETAIRSAPQPAEPVKVPSDAEIMAEVYAVCPDFDSAHEGIDEYQVVSAFRALLARYRNQENSNGGT